MIDQEYEVVPIDSVQEHPQNPNRGREAVIDESIDVNGWYGACIVQKSSRYILAGNHRWRVAKQRGFEEIPVIIRDVDDQTALRILLVDNEATRLGECDPETLEQVLESLETLDGTGFGVSALEDAIDAEEEPEEVQAADEGDVPEDAYEPSYGIMVVCEDEADQERQYAKLSELYADQEGRLRVVAV